MKVYLLQYQGVCYDSGQYDVVGVYSSHEKAQERIDKFCKWDQSSLSIEECELDAE